MSAAVVVLPLVADITTEIKVREVPQRNGGMLYTFDWLNNPTGFAFQPGGLFEGRCLISGSIGTATGNATSIALCRAFMRAIKQGFEKVKSYYLGPEATRLLEEGMRLTTSIKSPPNYDFKL